MQLIDGFIGNTAGDDLNKLGHRCKDTELINFHNYFLVAGDNLSLSFHIPLENTYPYLLAQKLKMSYYNLSVFNGGMDVCKNNILVWHKRFKMPKFIIIDFTFLNALVHYDLTKQKLFGSNFDDENIKELYDQADHNGYFYCKKLLLEKLIINYYNCPIYQLKQNNTLALLDNGIKNILIEDNMSHVEIGDLLFRENQVLTSKVRP